jgi:RNA polymerase sigma-70 factor (ECF subfamily)
MPQATRTDEELMRAYQGGDAAAFTELYRRHSGRIYGYLGKRIRSREEADEVFQAIFFKVHRIRHHFDFKFPVTQWLYVITKTVLLDHFRKQGRSVPIEDGADLSQIEGSRALNEETGLEVLELLNSEQRKVVEMRVFEEADYDLIAKQLGRNEAAVRQILSRALKKLRLGWKADA